MSKQDKTHFINMC